MGRFRYLTIQSRRGNLGVNFIAFWFGGDLPQGPFQHRIRVLTWKNLQVIDISLITSTLFIVRLHHRKELLNKNQRSILLNFNDLTYILLLGHILEFFEAFEKNQALYFEWKSQENRYKKITMLICQIQQVGNVKKQSYQKYNLEKELFAQKRISKLILKNHEAFKNSSPKIHQLKKQILRLLPPIKQSFADDRKTGYKNFFHQIDPPQVVKIKRKTHTKMKSSI